MSQAVLGMAGMTVPQRILKARHIAGKLLSNSSSFTTPKPTILQITDSATALEKAYNDSRGLDTGMMSIFVTKFKSFKSLMVLVLAYIQQESGGDGLIIESAGVNVKKLPSPQQTLGKVTGLSGKQGGLSGTTVLTWKALLRKKSYTIEKSDDNIVYTDTKTPCTKATVIIYGLIPETYTWFRVAGINGMGQGEWSSPVRVESK
jgi:hypothetical protein